MPFLPSLVIFDLDGTLIDYEHDFLFQEAERLLPLLGYPNISRAEFEKFFSQDNWFGFIKDETQRIKIEHAFWTSLNHHHKPLAAPVAGTIEALDRLATKNIKLAIATARSQLSAEIKSELEHTGLLKWIDIITSREAEKHPWRDKRQQIRLALAHAAVTPDAAFMVGDSPTDVWSAHKESIACILAVRTGRILDDVLSRENPHFIMDSAAEVPNIIPHTKK